MTARLSLVCTLCLAFWPSSYSMQGDEAINERSKEVSLHQEEERILGGQNARQGQFPYVGDEAINESSKGVSHHQEEERIAGGQSASQGQFPYVVSMDTPGNYRCTGSIISKNSILTAAHCCNGTTSDSSMEMCNARFEGTKARVAISKVTVHPAYNDTTLLHDIAILTTAEDIVYSSNVNSICIGARPGSPDQYVGKFATAIGYGRIDSAGQTTLTNICLGGIRKGDCQGQSGGPAVLDAKTKPVQIGVISAVNEVTGCGIYVGAPSVTTFVSPYIDWIKNVTSGTEVCFMA